jgi:hypothetical protein
LKTSELAFDMGLDLTIDSSDAADFRFIEFEVLQILQFRLACDNNPADYLKKTLNRLENLRINTHQKNKILEISSVFLSFQLLNWNILSYIFTIEECAAACIYMAVKYFEKAMVQG